MITRTIEDQIIKDLTDHKGIIIYGPRQAGKSTLLKMLESKLNNPVLWLNGDDADTRNRFMEANSSTMSLIIGNNKTIIIDEAQRIQNIGLCLKIIIDNFPETKIIATGSSSFELSNKINEPLTGRKWEYKLFPFSYQEMKLHHGAFEENRLLNQRLVYGYYPDVVNNPGREKEILNQLANSYLYKDILTWERILKPDALEKLVRALAFQIGNEVSYHELGRLSGLDNETVERYILLLERAFIVFRLSCFNRNLRTELKKSRKIYFYDNGLRNSIINQFNTIDLRNDLGALWENFMVSERMKFTNYQKLYSNTYFWRTKTQQEIDYIEEHSGKLFAWEFKWKPKPKFHLPNAFIKEYAPASTEIIHPGNFENFISI
jgi:predicted AAA+ superfamily ATPase